MTESALHLPPDDMSFVGKGQPEYFDVGLFYTGVALGALAGGSRRLD